VEACRNRNDGRRNSGGGPLRFARTFCLQHRLRHFLNEQWDAVGALDDVLPNTCRKELVADDAVDHGIDCTLRQPIDGKGGHVGPSDPRRLELWPERHDQEHAEAWYSVHETTK
jgi:hypothetical protein